MLYAQPRIDPKARIARNAIVIGDVEIGAYSLVLFFAVLRGDCGQRIVIGDNTNIQEGACIHVAPGFDTIVGDGVTIGHGATVHGCIIGDNTLVGMDASVIDGAIVGKECLIGAGALVTGSARIPDRSLVLGSPAKVVRTLTDEEVDSIYRNAQEYLIIADALLESGMCEEGVAVNFGL